LIGQSEKASLTTCNSLCMYRNHSSSLSIITTILNDHSLLNFCFLLFSTIFFTTIKSNLVSSTCFDSEECIHSQICLNLSFPQFVSGLVSLSSSVVVFLDSWWEEFSDFEAANQGGDQRSVIIIIWLIVNPETHLWFCFSGRLWSSLSQMHFLFRTSKMSSHSRGFCCHFLILFSCVIWECALGATVGDLQLQFTNIFVKVC